MNIGSLISRQFDTAMTRAAAQHVDDTAARGLETQASCTLSGKVDQLAIASGPLVPVADGPALTGSSLKFLVRAPGARQTYLFKPFTGDRTGFEAERAASSLRQAAGERAVPVASREVHMPDGQVLSGSVKPMVPNQGALAIDPSAWTTAQREQVLTDQAWMEFLGNYDTKVDQYVRQGDRALNIDWDRAFSDYETNAPLTRFKALSKVNPPAQNLLYQAYVHGRTDLDFRPLFETIGRIRGLSDAQVRRALTPYARDAFAQGGKIGPYETSEQFIQAVLQRKAGLSDHFHAFVDSLRAERAYHLGMPTVGFGGDQAMQNAWRDWQLRLAGVWTGSRAFVLWNQLIQRFKRPSTSA